MREFGKNFTGSACLAVAALFTAAPVTPADATSSLGPYASVKTYCGAERIPQNVATIPWVGCFILSARHSAAGTFTNHHVEVAAGADGEEVFTVDGTVVTNQHSPSGTNLEFIRVAGVAGYNVCEGASPAPCPSSITVWSRNTDHSVLFMVSECLPPTYHVCVLSQENWDYYKSRVH